MNPNIARRPSGELGSGQNQNLKPRKVSGIDSILQPDPTKHDHDKTNHEMKKNKKGVPNFANKKLGCVCKA